MTRRKTNNMPGRSWTGLSTTEGTEERYRRWQFERERRPKTHCGRFITANIIQSFCAIDSFFFFFLAL